MNPVIIDLMDDSGNFVIGSIKKEFYSNGALFKVIHRDMFNATSRLDGPAVIIYYDNGRLKLEEWWYDDLLHRADGPAHIEYDRACNVTRTEYWFDGKKVDSLKKEKNKVVIPECKRCKRDVSSKDKQCWYCGEIDPYKKE